MAKAFGLLRGLVRRGSAAPSIDLSLPEAPEQDAPRDVAAFLRSLVEAGLLDAANDGRAAAALRQTVSGTDCSILTDLGLIEETSLVNALAGFHGTGVTTPDALPAALPTLGAVPASFWARARMIPLRDEPEALTVAAVDIFDVAKRDALAHLLDKPVRTTVIGASVLENALRTLGSEEAGAGDLPDDLGQAEQDDLARLQDVASQAPIIRLGSRLLKTAFELNASDIHIEPGETDVRVRYRVDGVLVGAETLPKAVQMALTTRFKILAGLNIAELRLPQDGRMKVVDRGAATDLRVAALPTANGEALVMRILRQSRKVGTLGSLGFSADAETRLTGMIGRPNGIVLVSGPTGSGKTTTLYTALAMLNGTERKIITVEDPVEYRIAGVSQVQTHAAIGLDFAAALRSILRQDPDIVMIGEIRDGETARIAVQAALTGHLVLSTIHTNSAAATVTRLVEMGVEPYLIAATLNGVVAQRLVRLLCPTCSTPEPGHRARATGCPQCNMTGYRGRSVVGEVMEVDAVLRDLITDKATSGAIEAAAIQAGMTTLGASALAKVEAGETTLEEVLRHVELGPALAQGGLMPSYAYKAFDARGAVVDGRAEAPSKAEMAAQVLRQNLRLISAQEVEAGGGSLWTRDIKFGGRPKGRQIVDLVRELATLTEAGLTIDRALRLVADHAPASLKGRLATVIEAVVAGSTLSQALGRHRDVFSHDVIEVIAAGEKTRAFPTVLRNLAGSLERRAGIRQRLVSAMVYPAMLVLMSIGAITVVLTVLVPALQPLFDDPGVTPPPLIRFVASVNATLSQSWPTIGAGAAAILAGLFMLIRQPAVRRWIAEAALHAPLLGPILIGVEAGRLCRVLGTLVSADVSLPAAIAASRTIPKNPVFREAVAEAGRRMVEGARLSQSLHRLQPYMPVVLNLIATGEQVNRVGEILLHAADMQETESNTRIERLMSLLVPLMTAGMGLTIGGLVFSVMSAILSVNDLATAR